jgi:hypothetical protein
MRGKARLDHLFVSEMYIYRNNQNMIVIFALRLNIDDNFLFVNIIVPIWIV